MFVVGILGIILGTLYILVAALSRLPVYRNNYGLYASGGIALVGGVILVLIS